MRVWSLASLSVLRIHPLLLWLWCRPTAAVPIWPLAQELPYGTGTTVNIKKKKKEKDKEKEFVLSHWISNFHEWLQHLGYSHLLFLSLLGPLRRFFPISTPLTFSYTLEIHKPSHLSNVTKVAWPALCILWRWQWWGLVQGGDVKMNKDQFLSFRVLKIWWASQNNSKPREWIINMVLFIILIPQRGINTVCVLGF